MGDDVKPWSEQLREQGREEGIEQGITAVVLRMHAKGKSIEDIMIATELSEEDINRIIENEK